LRAYLKTSGIKPKPVGANHLKKQNRPNVQSVRQECGSIHSGDTRISSINDVVGIIL